MAFRTRGLLPVLAVSACIATLSAIPALAEGPSGLPGTWTLVSATQTENGRTHDFFGPQPLGQIIFSPNGQFSDIIIRSDLPNFQVKNRTAGTPEENAAVVKGSIAFFGTYTLSGDQLHLHIVGSSFPNWRGEDQTRTVHVTGDQLTWENPAASSGGTAKLVWQRTK